jgi:hypothetical protein
MTTAPPRPDQRDLPELDAEQEIDLRRYWTLLVARWWLLAGGILAGLFIGYLASIGGGNVYEAKALLYLGQPLSISGGTPLQGLATNPKTVDEVVHSEDVVSQAASRAALPVRQVRNNVSTQTIAGTKSQVKSGQTPLYEITLTGHHPTKTALAALSIARQVVGKTAGYPKVKLKAIEADLASIASQLQANAVRQRSINTALRNAVGLAPLDRLVLVQQQATAIDQRAGLISTQGTLQQQKSLAENVELPRIIGRPQPIRTTARSTRGSMLVGALIGLLLGALAAFLWDPVMRRVGRNQA